VSAVATVVEPANHHEWHNFDMQLDECWICKSKIDGNLAAIGRSGDQLQYVPFVQDLRSSALMLAHPVCFATTYGVDSLVAIVHEHDFVMAQTRGPRF
jgi:hypothetical protein